MTTTATLIRPRMLRGTSLFEIEGQDEPTFNEVMTFDLTAQELHDTDAMVTDHPIEDGGNISDHVQPEPRRLSLDVEMTATPLYRDGEPGIIEETHDALVELVESGQPLRVVTSVEDYGNMVLTQYQTRVDENTGERLEASLSFKEVTIVSPEIVEIDPSVIREQFRSSAKASEETGRQTPEEPTEEEAEAGGTILNNLFESAAEGLI